MTPKANDRRSVGLVVTSMLIWGSVGVVRRFIPLPSALLAFVRGVLGGLFLLVFTLLRKKGAADRLPRALLFRLMLTGALIGINWILLFEAFNCTAVSVATLCYYMQPTIVILLSPLVFGEKLTLRKALCAAVAIVGMALVSGVVGSGGVQSGDLRGVLFALGAALLYAIVVMLNKKTPGVDAYQRTTVLLLSAGLVLLPYLLVTGGFSFAGASPKALLLLAVLGIVHTGIAYTMYFGSMEGLQMQTIAVLSYIDPVSTLFFAALFLHEALTLSNIVGAVLILGSALLSELSPVQPE